MNIAIIQLLVDTSLLIPPYASIPLLRYICQHSQISLSGGLFQSPLMVIKIFFLLLGFRQVSYVPHPDVCSFPAIPWEQDLLDIWLYPLFCLLAAILRGDILQRNPFRITEDLFTSPHLCKVNIYDQIRPPKLPSSSRERSRYFYNITHLFCLFLIFVMIQRILPRKSLLLSPSQARTLQMPLVWSDESQDLRRQ